MRKFTHLFFTVLMVMYINAAISANALEITAILSPVQGTQIVIGQSTQFELELTNNHTITFTTQDTGLLVLGFFNGSSITNLQAIGGYIPQSDLLPGGKTTITFNLTFNGMSPGNYAPAFGIVWRKNPNPTSATFQYRVYQFVNSSGLAERFSKMKDLYYSNGKIYLNIENKGNQQVMVNILNLNGQLVKFEKFQLNNQGISSQSIDVANLPKGVYIVSLNIEGNLTTRKVYID
ncbi:MAG TPA: T9SS type A sorting domain-containing protein [Bacteroidia bacterium]|nr:T9SS type A sorting domain-containing protein [Sphingobacteriales bacterium]HPD65451.1 T9SS type A sorting domain-containing protein [Bacteroidia bacterium]HRS59106.1 T9SS type A sorting domain-containing protein [Bacteroidia bacterium]